MDLQRFLALELFRWVLTAEVLAGEQESFPTRVDQPDASRRPGRKKSLQRRFAGIEGIASWMLTIFDCQLPIVESSQV
jgi:hypothetical protein